MKFWMLALTIITLFGAAATAAGKNQTGVFAGYNKGYATDYREPKKGLIFLDEKKKPILALGPRETTLWFQSNLGSCRLIDPTWYAVDKSDSLLTIHVFANGIIYEEGGEYTSIMDFAQADKWWRQLGLKRVYKK